MIATKFYFNSGINPQMSQFHEEDAHEFLTTALEHMSKEYLWRNPDWEL